MNGVGHVLGLDNGSGPWYLFWSGFFSDVAIFAAVGIWIWHHQCHEKRCIRPARFEHPTNNKKKVCHKHRVLAEGSDGK